MSLFKSLKPMTPEQSKMMMGLGIGLLTNKGRFNDGLGQGLALGNQMVANLKEEERKNIQDNFNRARTYELMNKINNQRNLMGLPPLQIEDMQNLNTSAGAAGAPQAGSQSSLTNNAAIMEVARLNRKPANEMEMRQAAAIRLNADPQDPIARDWLEVTGSGNLNYIEEKNRLSGTYNSEYMVDSNNKRYLSRFNSKTGETELIDLDTNEIVDPGTVKGLRRDVGIDTASKEVGKASGQAEADLYNQAAAARLQMTNLDNFERLVNNIDNAFDTETGAITDNELLQKLASMATQLFNLDADAFLDLDNIQAAKQVMREMLMAERQKLRGQGTITDNEAKALEDTLPNLGNTPEANKIVLDILRKAGQRKINKAKAWREAKKDGETDYLGWSFGYDEQLYSTETDENTSDVAPVAESSDDAFNLNQIEDAIESGSATPIEPTQLKQLNEVAYNENLQKGDIVKDNETNQQFKYLGDNKWETVGSPKSLKAPAPPTMPSVPRVPQNQTPQRAPVGGPHPLNRSFGR